MPASRSCRCVRLRRIEVADRADAHAVEHVVLDRDALHVRLEAEQREAGFEPVGVRRGAERAGLQQEAAGSGGWPRPRRRRRGGGPSFSGTTTSNCGRIS